MGKFARFAANWTEGWRVIGRFIWFQIVYSLYLIPLTISGTLLERFTRGQIDPKHPGAGTIAVLLAALFSGLETREAARREVCS